MAPYRVAVLACCLVLLSAARPAATQGTNRKLCCAQTECDPNTKAKLCNQDASGVFLFIPLLTDDDGETINGDDYDNSAYAKAVSHCEDALGLTAIGGMSCLKVTGVGGDPHITGFDGSDYLLWGKPNTTYNMLSERYHHMNIRLYHPPRRAADHALYIDAVGILIHGARISIHLEPPVGSAPAAMVLEFQAVAGVTETVRWTGRPIERAIDTHAAYFVKTSEHIVITSEDLTVSVVLLEGDHLDVHVDEVATTWGEVHGVMGQTHKAAFQLKYSYAKGTSVGELPTVSKRAEAAKKKLVLQGTEDDYITGGLLSTDDKFSRFVGAAMPANRKLRLVMHRAQGSRVQTAAGVSVVGGAIGGHRSMLTDTYTCQ